MRWDLWARRGIMGDLTSANDEARDQAGYAAPHRRARRESPVDEGLSLPWAMVAMVVSLGLWWLILRVMLWGLS